MGWAAARRIAPRWRADFVDHHSRATPRAAHRVLVEGPDDASAPTQRLRIAAHDVLRVPAGLARLLMPLAPRLGAVGAVAVDVAGVSGQHVL